MGRLFGPDEQTEEGEGTGGQIGRKGDKFGSAGSQSGTGGQNEGTGEDINSTGGGNRGVQLNSNITEIEISVKGMGAKETFSPVTLIYYAYLKQKMADDAKTPEEKEIYLQIGFGEMTDMVYKIYCKEHGYELMMNVAGTATRVKI